MIEFSGELEVTDPLGLHARPAAGIVQLVKESGFTVRISRPNEASVSAASPLRLMTLKVKQGERLLVVIDAESQETAQELFGQIQDLLQGGS